MSHAEAITITTGQVQSWGIVGVLVIILAAVLVMKLATSLVGKTVWTCIALGALFLCWQQHTAIETSIKQCNPHVLFLQLQISDPAQHAKCVQALKGK